jgi:hypothetical protein
MEHELRLLVGDLVLQVAALRAKVAELEKREAEKQGKPE